MSSYIFCKGRIKTWLIVSSEGIIKLVAIIRNSLYTSEYRDRCKGSRFTVGLLFGSAE